jgi:type IV secretory pathway TrbD component
MNEHTPQLSVWPILVALALTLIMIGILFTWIVALLGVLTLLVSLWMWVQENRLTAEHIFVEDEEHKHG